PSGAGRRRLAGGAARHEALDPGRELALHECREPRDVERAAGERRDERGEDAGKLHDPYPSELDDSDELDGGDRTFETVRAVGVVPVLREVPPRHPVPGAGLEPRVRERVVAERRVELETVALVFRVVLGKL